MLIEFILPCYNEKQLLKQNSLKLLNFLNQQNYSFDWKIVLLLNGTTDDSKPIALEMKEQYNKIAVFIVEEKGKGNAIKKYFDYSSADFLIYMDIDLAVDIKNINDLISPLLNNNYDLVIGSRLLKESTTNRSAIRELSSRVYIFLSKLILKHSLSDLQCGFKGIKKEAFKKISPFIQDKFWFFDTELLIFAILLNRTIKEIPVDWSENRYEKRKSKIKIIKNSLDFIKNLLQLKKRLKAVKNNKSF